MEMEINPFGGCFRNRCMTFSLSRQVLSQLIIFFTGFVQSNGKTNACTFVNHYVLLYYILVYQSI